MKIRRGHVSNSSSTSFTCQICDHSESGMDMGLEDANMAECNGGHLICLSHMKDDIGDLLEGGTAQFSDFDQKTARELFWNGTQWKLQKHYTKEQILALDKEEFETRFKDEIEGFDWYDLRHGFPKAWCPICQFDDILPEDVMYFLMYTNDITMTSVKELFKKEYPDYVAFKNKLSKMKEKVNR